MKYSDLLTTLRASLGPLYSDREIESMGRLVLEHLTGLSWVQIRLNIDREFDPGQAGKIREIIERLEKHEPIQYILGETEFYGLVLKVRSGVLIPRGETEELVDWIVRPRLRGDDREGGGGLENSPRLRGDDREGGGGLENVRGRRFRIIDVGCGSGAIAIALAKKIPGAEVLAADISEEALALTRENATLNGVGVETVHMDILQTQAMPGAFDIIVSNPPYVPMGEMTAMDQHVVDYEPEMALFVPDDDPLLFYKAIAGFAAGSLSSGGQVFVEIHDRLGEETAEVFREVFSGVEIRKDIHGKDRMIRAYHG